MSSKENEASNVQLKAARIKEQSLESTRRMVQLCEESHASGAQTLHLLDHQGEQLEKIETNLDLINGEIRSAEKNLGGMDKSGCCCGLFEQSGKNPGEEQYWTNGEEKVIKEEPKPRKRSIRGDLGERPPSPSDDPLDADISTHLTQITLMVGNLRNMAVDMGDEMSSQQRQIERIEGKTTTNELHIKKANEKAVRVLKKS
jgi:synaptosomal-associated protein 25